MSGLSVQISTASFTKQLTGMMLPKRQFLLGEYTFGKDFATSSRNHANASVPLLVVGSPAYNAVFGASVSSGTSGVGFDTQITPPRDATVIVVRKRLANAGANMTVVGNQLGNGGALNRTGFYDDDSVGPAQCQLYSNVAAAPNISATYNAPAKGSWFFEAGTTLTSAAQKLYHYDTGSRVIAVSPVAGNGWDNKVYVGTPNNTGNAAWTTDILHLGIYSTPLTDSEVDDAYASLKAYYALLGAAIL